MLAFSFFTASDYFWLSFMVAGLAFIVVRAWTINPEATKLGLRIVWHLIKRGP